MGCFENTVFDWIKANRLLKTANRVLLAVSGGADSVAMAHALAKLNERGDLVCDYVVGHVNHCLRGDESNTDEAFVRELGDSLGMRVCVESVDVTSYAKSHKLSIETAGRQLRLKTLAAMAAEQNFDFIATAHHKDDQAETLIHRLMRGTGFRGLCGIRPVSIVGRGIYIRPMLNLRRSDIVNYCQSNSIQWRQDKSNHDLRFTRNRIRHQLLPRIQSDADLTHLLVNLSVAARRLQDRIDSVVQRSMDVLSAGDEDSSRICYDQKKLSACSPWVFYEIIRQGITAVGGGLRGYSQSHFDTIYDMAGQSKARADIPENLEVVVDKGIVIIQPRECKAAKKSYQKAVSLTPGETVTFGQWKISSRLMSADKGKIERFLETKDRFIEWFDADTIVGDIQIRSRKDGDRFYPIGSQGKKKVARFLQDAQLDAITRQHVFIVADTEKILWLAPIRMSEKARITRQTRQILEVRVWQPARSKV